MSWVTDESHKKVADIKNKFRDALKEVSKDNYTTYYDFLLIAKQLGFRFEEAAHLMSLKNHFLKNKNVLDKRKLVDLLAINQNYLSGEMPDKLIVKFNIPEHHFDPIQQVTNQDDELNNEADELKTESENWQNSKNMESKMAEDEAEYKEKIEIIVNIKMDEMAKKIALINYHLPVRIIEAFDNSNKPKINQIDFKKGIIRIFSISQEKMKISEDDIKTIFYLLDTQKDAEIGQEQLEQLKNPQKFLEKLREFYKSRVNPALIKNTEFKKSKLKNNIQIFQVKNPSTLQLQKIEEAVLTEQNAINEFRQEIKRNNLKTKPRFGPLKHTYNKKKQSWGRQAESQKDMADNGMEIWMQRERIEKILKASKEKRKQNGSHETIANKLRSLFIHKVILPRQKMLQQQKELENKRFSNVKQNGKNQLNNLSIKPTEKK